MADNVVVRLVLDTSQYSAGASKAARETQRIDGAVGQTKKGIGGLTDTVKKAGLALGAAFAAKVAVDFAKQSIQAFSDLEESINAVNVSYLDGSDAIHKLGENSATQFGLSTAAVNDAAVAMSAFAEKIDAADPPGAFQNVLQRATDFASVMNLEVDEALRLFQSGLAGESEPLRKFGVDVSAATISVIALEQGIIQQGEKMDEAQKIQARYAAIMAQTAKTAGDFANTSDGLANTQKILGAQWKEMQAVVGKALAPAMISLLNAGKELLPIAEGLITRFATYTEQIIPLIDLVASLTVELDVLAGSAEDVTEQFTVSGTLFDAFWLALNPGQQLGDLALDMAGAADEMIAFGDDVGRTRVETLGLKDAIEHTSPPVGTLASVTAEAAAAARLLFLDTLTAAEAAETATERFWAEVEAIRGVTQAMAEAVNPTLRLLGANERFIAGQKKQVDARKRVADAEKGLNEAKGTKERADAQEELAAAQDDLASSTLDLAGASLDLQSAAAGAEGTIADAVGQIVELARIGGATDAEIRTLIDSLDAIPESIIIGLDLDIREANFARVERLLGNLGPITSGDTSGGVRRKGHGGSVNADEPFIVGDRGPELFIPGRSGTIIPNNAMGSGGVTVNVYQPETLDFSADLAAGLIAAAVTQQVERIT